ncbi:MAG: Gfo/Idh/MocA family oxidoreductase, partial [Eubacterium sp.]|nr:Gfo/Idh/MocA family oxidoreductase [Eubacterium sp.]
MLRVGVIGCGGMGRSHIDRITNRTQGAQVVAVSDVFEEGAKKGAEIAGEVCKVYTDRKQLIIDPYVDALLIVCPGFALCEDLLEAIKV